METGFELGVLAQSWDSLLMRHGGRGWGVQSFSTVWSPGFRRKNLAKLTTFSYLNLRLLVTFCLINCLSLFLNYNTNNERSGSDRKCSFLCLCIFFLIYPFILFVCLTLKKLFFGQAVVVHGFSPRSWEVEAGSFV